MRNRIVSSGTLLFFISWILVNIIGRVLGISATDIIGYIIGELDIPEFHRFSLLAVLVCVLIGAVYGVIVGGLQWFALRRKIHQASRWVASSTMSWPLAVVGSYLIYVYRMNLCLNPLCRTATLVATFMWIGAIGGVLIGITQWYVLRCQVRRAAWWILTGVGEVFIWRSFRSFLWDQDYISTFVWVIVTGLLSGLLLIWLLRQPRELVAPPNHSLEQT